jgi:hypothetical protein
MLRSAMTIRPNVHVPLNRLALCADCEACFELGLETCPACSSRTWIPLSRFIGERDYPAAVPSAA